MGEKCESYSYLMQPVLAEILSNARRGVLITYSSALSEEATVQWLPVVRHH